MTTMGILANNKGFLPTCVTARWPRHSPFPRDDMELQQQHVSEEAIYLRRGSIRRMLILSVVIAFNRRVTVPLVCTVVIG